MKVRNILTAFSLLFVATFLLLTGHAQPVTHVATGSYHSLFLKSDGSLWAMGSKTAGQLGDGTYNNSTNLPELIVVSNVMAVAAGKNHSLFLKRDGSLWAMGNNFYGQLGGTSSFPSFYSVPQQIVASNVTAIAAGGSHSLFLQSDGSLWAMGGNNVGQLGDGTYFDTKHPKQIVTTNVTAIAAGTDHSLFLKNDGSLWAMGANAAGQLGDGTYSTTNLPEEIVTSNVTAIAAGANHSLFVKSDGSLWAMGSNVYGQLGDGTQFTLSQFTNRPEQIVASNVTAVAAGDNHSLFLKSDGSLWAMGNDTYGQLGNGINTDISSGIKQPEQIVAGGVSEVDGGAFHTLFIKSDGSVWAMGSNSQGQLGDGTNIATNRLQQILAPYNEISGQILTDGSMRLSFVGIAGASYALEWAPTISPANWIPVATNPASSYGPLNFTNNPNPATDNFWRIRFVP